MAESIIGGVGSFAIVEDIEAEPDMSTESDVAVSSEEDDDVEMPTTTSPVADTTPGDVEEAFTGSTTQHGEENRDTVGKTPIVPGSSFAEVPHRSSQQVWLNSCR